MNEATKQLTDTFLNFQQKLGVPPLDIDTVDKFESTKHFGKWFKHYDRVSAPYKDRDAKAKTQMLLINIGEAAATRYDLATKKTGEANEYLNARATLESIYCLPQPHCEAQIRFNRVKPLQNESPIQYIERLKMATELCEFENPDQEVMAALLANCTHQKWQERRLSQKWTKANLSEAETYARELEMAYLLTKEVRSTGEGRVNAVKSETKCGNCGVYHEPGFCKAKGKTCFRCQRIGHFGKLCRSSRGRNRGNYRGSNARGNSHQSGSGRGTFHPRGRGGRNRGGRGRNFNRGYNRSFNQNNFREHYYQNQQQHNSANQRNVKNVRAAPQTSEFQGNEQPQDSFSMSNFGKSLQELGYE